MVCNTQVSPDGPAPALTAVLSSFRNTEFLRIPALAQRILEAASVRACWVQGVADRTWLSGFDLDSADGPTPHWRVHVAGIPATLDVTTSTHLPRHSLAQPHVAARVVPAVMGSDALQALGAIHPHGVLSDSLTPLDRP